MITKTKSITAAKFESSCLSWLEQVADTGRELVITKQGKPIAKVVPVIQPKTSSLAGSVLWEDDLVSPTGAVWEAAS